MANSSAEYFDVVDEWDHVVGRRTREEVHREGLYHRAVHIIVFRTSGELFLQKRSHRKDTAPNRWVSSCSGHVDAGEHYEEAARRELGEEIGIPGGIVELVEIDQVDPVSETGNEFVRVYALRGYDGPLELDPEEVSEGCWRTPEEVDQWIGEKRDDFSDSFVYLWGRYRKM